MIKYYCQLVCDECGVSGGVYRDAKALNTESHENGWRKQRPGKTWDMAIDICPNCLEKLSIPTIMTNTS